MGAVCLAVYLAVTIHASLTSPSSVQSRLWKRAWGYPMNFFLTSGPILFLIASSDTGVGFEGEGFIRWWWARIMENKPFWFNWQAEVAFILLAGNGLLNVLTYACASGALRQVNVERPLNDAREV